MNHEKSLGAVLVDIMDELKAFLETRLQILRAEIKDMLRGWKYCIPLLLVAGLFLVGSWIVITFGIVALVYGWFQGGPFYWAWAGLIVGAAYLAIAGILGGLALGALRKVGIVPRRTLKVLKQDQSWMESEAKAQ